MGPFCHIFSKAYQFVYVIKVFYSPTDAQLNCLKKINYIKIDIKTAPHVSVQSLSSGSALFDLVKVTVVKIIN
jgi:hypothetical protein